MENEEMKNEVLPKSAKPNRDKRNKGKPSRNGKGNSKQNRSTNKTRTNGLAGQLLTNAASFSFYGPLGQPQLILDDTGSTPVQFPGVMSATVLPTPGIARSKTDPLNIMAQQYYNFLRLQNTGTRIYEPADSAEYLLLLDCLVYWYAFGMRAYGTFMTYSPVNRYLPRALLAAQGWDYDSIREAGAAKFRSILDNVAAKSRSFAFPQGFGLFSEHFNMFLNIYTDHPSMKSQMYLYKPAGYYVFRPYTDSKGGKLGFHAIDPFIRDSAPGRFEGITLSEYASIMDEILDSMWLQEDVGIMSSDVIKAFGFDKLFMLPTVADDYTTMITYDESEVQRITNSVYHGLVYSGDADVTQNEGYLINDPVFHSRAFGYTTGRVLDMPQEAPTPVEVANATVFTTVAREESHVATPLISGYNTEQKIQEASLAIGCYFHIIQLAEEGDPVFLSSIAGDNVDRHWETNVHYSAVSNAKWCLETWATISKFDWHPMLVAVSGNEAGVAKFECILGDVHNYHVLAPNDLTNIHRANMYTVLSNPLMGQWGMLA